MTKIPLQIDCILCKWCQKIL